MLSLNSGFIVSAGSHFKSWSGYAPDEIDSDNINSSTIGIACSSSLGDISDLEQSSCSSTTPSLHHTSGVVRLERCSSAMELRSSNGVGKTCAKALALWGLLTTTFVETLIWHFTVCSSIGGSRRMLTFGEVSTITIFTRLIKFPFLQFNHVCC